MTAPVSAAPSALRHVWALRLTQLTGVLLFLSFAYILYLHQSVMLLPSPQEYREGSIVLTTELMLHGGNPYAVKNQPISNNVYGVGYNLVVVPFAKLFGNGFVVHRAVSGVFVLGVCALLFQTLRSASVPNHWAFAATVLFYADIGARCARMGPFASPLSIIARPDALGLLLFLGSVLIPMQRKFSNGSLVLSAVLAACAFYTKPYFLIGLPMVLAYVFLFRSKLRAVLHGVGFAVAFVAILYGVVHRGETYWAVIVKGNELSVARKWPHFREQVWVYVTSVPGTLTALAIVGFYGVRRLARLKRRRGSKVGDCVSIRQLSAPLLKVPVDFLWFVLVCMAVLLIWKLGPHPGNSMIYFYQLFSPFLLLIVFRMFRRQRARASLLMVSLILLDSVLLLGSGFFFDRGLPAVPGANQEIWDQWRAILAERRNVYVGGPLSYMVYQQGKPVYDNGMSEYYVFSLQNPKTPFDAYCREEYGKFRDDLYGKVRREEFDLIVLPYGETNGGILVPMPSFINAQDLRGHYKMFGRDRFPMDWSPYFHGVVFAPIGRPEAK